MLVSLLLINVSLLIIGFRRWKKKTNHKTKTQKIPLALQLGVWLQVWAPLSDWKETVEWKVGLSQEQVSYTDTFSTIVFLRQQVHVMWFDGSSQQVFHITHFTSSQAHSNPIPKISILPKISISPTQSSFLIPVCLNLCMNWSASKECS